MRATYIMTVDYTDHRESPPKRRRMYVRDGADLKLKLDAVAHASGGAVAWDGRAIIVPRAVNLREAA